VRVKLRHIPPNVATSLSVMVAILSVMLAREGNFDLAAWMILWSVVLDKLDGTLARMLKAGTEFGVEFDSLADFCAFGVAPGFFAYEMLLHHPDVPPVFRDGHMLWLLRLCVGIYVVAVAARLARFNVDTPVLGDKYFMGIPTTMCGGILALAYLTFAKYGMFGVLEWFPVFLLVSGFLMVSSVRLPKLTKRKSKVMNGVTVVGLVITLVCGALRVMPEILFGMAMAYLFVGVIHTKVTGVVRRARTSS
jgi:CDP-diacylglycerol---serine O-phosphatidyltransferase